MPLNPNIIAQGALPDPEEVQANVPQSTTSQVLVPGVAGKKIHVTSGFWICGATATNLTFESWDGAAATAISPVIANGANGGFELGYNPQGHFETEVGEGLSVSTGTGATTGLKLQYVQV